MEKYQYQFNHANCIFNHYILASVSVSYYRQLIQLLFRFGYNAVPQTNDIQISKSASIAYFALSIFTLFLMYLQYEFVTYGYKSAITCWRIFIALYGLTIIGLGIAFLAIEVPANKTRSEAKWLTMSNN